MPAPFGVTTTGFSAKTLEEIKDEIEAEQHANISASLNVSTETPIGQVNGIIASKLRELWEVAQAAYNAFDPDAAADSSLTNLSLVTGTQRNAATKSVALCNVDLDAGVYAVGTLVASVTGNPDARFVNRDEITSPGGLVTGQTFEGETAGPVQALASTLTVIAEPVVGWNSITNPTDATEGANIETDPALRVRREIEVTQSGSSNVDAILANVLQVTGVSNVTVLENFTDLTDSDGLPLKSFEVIIFDGIVPAADDDEVAQAIWDNKPAGILSFGSTADSGTATDDAGNTHTVDFSRVSVRDVWLEFDINVNAADYQSNDAGVKTAVADYGDLHLTIGEAVVLAELHVPVFGITGVVDITAIRAGFAISPVGTSNLSIGVREIADLDTARIVVNSTPV